MSTPTTKTRLDAPSNQDALAELLELERKINELEYHSALDLMALGREKLNERVARNHCLDPYSVARESRENRNSLKYGRQTILTALPLLLADIIVMIACFQFALLTCSMFSLGIPVSAGFALLKLLVSMVGVFGILGLYQPAGMNPIFEFRQTAFAVLAIGLVNFAFNFSHTPATFSLVVMGALFVAIPILRSLTRNYLTRYRWWGIRCIVFDADRRINQLFKNHQANSHHGLRPIGFIQSDVPELLDQSLLRYYLGDIEDANKKMNELDAYCAVVHRRGRPDHELFEFIDQHLTLFSKVIIVSDDNRLPSLWSHGHTGGIVMQDRLHSTSAQVVKRAMDICLASAALVAFLPFLIGISIWTKLTAPGPLFFGHERIGKHGKRFKVWKFRTMVVNADKVLAEALANDPELQAEWDATYKLKNDPRITLPGKILRKTSLDELPQLWNVIKGEMSLVGPRPIVQGEIERYDSDFETYLRVLPGVTGFWQISGRNLTTYSRRVELDAYYVRNWSIWFDLYIMARTLKTVICREGAF